MQTFEGFLTNIFNKKSDDDIIANNIIKKIGQISNINYDSELINPKVFTFEIDDFPIQIEKYEKYHTRWDYSISYTLRIESIIVDCKEEVKKEIFEIINKIVTNDKKVNTNHNPQRIIPIPQYDKDMISFLKKDIRNNFGKK